MSEAHTERRRHRLYLTRNTEYHTRDGICVAVRDRQSGRWLHAHLALQRPLAGVRTVGRGPRSTGEPGVGDALFFASSGERDLLTSALCAIDRPAKDVVARYPG
ncbi:MAG: hypothetical protein IT376_06320 [Polyangiaceae bacterium]|nr:hypothetical protein [Polyangiaceae bacterium]